MFNICPLIFFLNSIDKCVVKAICQGFFQRKRELHGWEELNETENIIYQPPSLHEVWLDEAGQ